MSDVFISYKREDEPRVEPLQIALKNAGLDVWWDKEIRGGDQWRQRILAELEAAQCVLVVWSHASTGPTGDFVVDEANRAKQRGVLLQVRIDNVKPPLGFGEYQALDLIGWNCSTSHPKFLDVKAAVAALVAGVPIPAPLAASRQKTRCIRIASALAAATIGLVLAAKVPAIRAATCGLPLLSRFFTHLETTDTWKTEERRRPLVIPTSFTPFPTIEAARADALARAPDLAKDACEGLNQADFHLIFATPLVKDWICRKRLSGYGCTATGTAVCQVSVRYQAEVRTCP
jgi:hypothetical protein